MINYLLFILLIIVCIKSLTNNYEYMTENETNVSKLKNIGFAEDVAEKIITNSSTICAVPNIGGGGGDGVFPPDLNVNEKSELIFKDYKLKIQSGIDFHTKLNSLEEAVFINFYGPLESKWKPEYEKWKESREKTIEDKIKSKCSSLNTNNTTTTIIDVNQVQDKIKTLSFLEKISKDMYSNNYLHGENRTDPNLSIRKMQYRSVEEDKIELYNSYINWIYYLIFFTIIILLYSQSKLNLMKNIIIYLFLIVLPIMIYPYAFKILKYLIDTIYNYSANTLPQNAFMND